MASTKSTNPLQKSHDRTSSLNDIDMAEKFDLLEKRKNKSLSTFCMPSHFGWCSLVIVVCNLCVAALLLLMYQTLVHTEQVLSRLADRYDPFVSLVLCVPWLSLLTGPAMLSTTFRWHNISDGALLLVPHILLQIVLLVYSLVSVSVLLLLTCSARYEQLVNEHALVILCFGITFACYSVLLVWFIIVLLFMFNELTVGGKKPYRPAASRFTSAVRMRRDMNRARSPQRSPAPYQILIEPSRALLPLPLESSVLRAVQPPSLNTPAFGSYTHLMGGNIPITVNRTPLLLTPDHGINLNTPTPTASSSKGYSQLR